MYDESLMYDECLMYDEDIKDRDSLEPSIDSLLDGERFDMYIT